MARYDDDETPWTRQLLVGASVLLAVALVIGGVVSVFALGAAKVSGIDEAGSVATQKPSLFIPSGRPTTRVDGFPDPSGAAGSTTPSATGSPSASPTRRTPPLTLRATPAKVAAGQRIYLTGQYRGGAGAQLQVQRREAGWSDFPVTVTVGGQRFSTYVSTSRTGVNRFRVHDPVTDRSSNVVRIVVG